MKFFESSPLWKALAVCRFQLARLVHFGRFTASGIGLMGSRARLIVGSAGSLSVGRRFILSDDAMVQSNANLTVGDSFFLNAYSRIVCYERISIGDRVTIASHVTIVDHDHRMVVENGVVRMAGYEHGAIKIGHDVWIGDKATLLRGTTLGNGVVVGAGSLVRGEFPDHVVIAGSPARIVRNLL